MTDDLRDAVAVGDTVTWWIPGVGPNTDTVVYVDRWAVMLEASDGWTEIHDRIPAGATITHNGRPLEALLADAAGRPAGQRPVLVTRWPDVTYYAGNPGGRLCWATVMRADDGAVVCRYDEDGSTYAGRGIRTGDAHRMARQHCTDDTTGGAS